MKLYVGNLSPDASETSLRELFTPHGQVASAAIVLSRDTGRSCGFGFVEMDHQGAIAAIGALNGKPIDGRDLTVVESRAATPARRHSGASGGDGGEGGRDGGLCRPGTGGRAGW